MCCSASSAPSAVFLIGDGVNRRGRGGSTLIVPLPCLLYSRSVTVYVFPTYNTFNFMTSASSVGSR